ncbi:LOW QUALITY PROTEIN: proto-oncogene Mas-like [Elgaria multicarinata webbii]|uniref:LOW QUALITY PROTEIN: proto-oncogene Mas-like n=1 Tax=Elgaria multicarinata webbii TaxID=159646 RepID=UPI002FCD069A
MKLISDATLPPIFIFHYIHPWNIFFLPVIVVVICILGLVGNGNVIWLLGFKIKRNSFTIYILNLAVADVGVLISLLMIVLHFIFKGFLIELFVDYPLFLMFYELFTLTYSSGQLLLTTISIERCVSVLFPIWHRCHHPSHLSTTLCAFIWVLTFLLCGTNFTISTMSDYNTSIQKYKFIINALLCLSLLTFSSLALFIKICFKSKQRKRGKLLTAILFALLFFLILAFPLTAFYLISNLLNRVFVDFFIIGILCSSLNSSVNPLIYFLVGRNKKAQSRESMKIILQRVFKEEEDSREQMEPWGPTQA